MKFFVIILSVYFSACFVGNSPLCWVEITNNSKFTIDSRNVKINNKLIKFETIVPGETIKKSTPRDSINAKHDVVYSFKGFINDSLKLKEIVFSNDLGSVSERFGVEITDSLKLKVLFDK